MGGEQDAAGREQRARAPQGRAARVRVFVAIVFTDRLAAEIDGLRRALAPELIARLPPHCTLIPPQNVRVEEWASLEATIRAAAAASAPFRLTLGPIGTFLPRTPVAYLACNAEDGVLESLRSRLAVGPLAPPRRVERPFVAHCTLTTRLSPAMASAVSAVLSPFRAATVVDRVVLLVQEDGPAHRWRPRADYLLGAASVLGRGGVELEMTWSSLADSEALALLGEDATRPLGEFGDSRIVVARWQGQAVAAAVCRLASGALHIDQLLVQAEHRRQGVATQLVIACERLARESLIPTLMVQACEGSSLESFAIARGFCLVERVARPGDSRALVRLSRRVA